MSTFAPRPPNTMDFHAMATGRPKISIEIRNLIKTMANENPKWGTPPIHGELLSPGFEIDESTVSIYLKRFRTEKPRPRHVEHF